MLKSKLIEELEETLSYLDQYHEIYMEEAWKKNEGGIPIIGSIDSRDFPHLQEVLVAKAHLLSALVALKAYEDDEPEKLWIEITMDNIVKVCKDAGLSYKGVYEKLITAQGRKKVLRYFPESKQFEEFSI